MLDPEQSLADTARPPVHPSLVDHLRKVFTPTRAPAKMSAEDSVFYVAAWQGEQAVIDYLSTLLPGPVREANEKENERNELLQAEDEHPGPDPRRPSSRSRS